MLSLASIWQIFWRSVWHFVWHFIWHSCWHSIWRIFWQWHIFWSYLAFYLTYILTFYLALFLASILTSYLTYVRVGTCPAESGARDTVQAGWLLGRSNSAVQGALVHTVMARRRRTQWGGARSRWDKLKNRMAVRWPIGRQYLTSSDPRPDTLFWHSFWHIIWKYIILTFYPTFFLANTLVAHHVFIPSGILSGIYSDILSCIYSGILSGFYSDILSGIYSDVLSCICSGILSGFYSDILLSILAFDLESFQAFILASILTFRLAFYSAFCHVFGPMCAQLHQKLGRVRVRFRACYLVGSSMPSHPRSSDELAKEEKLRRKEKEGCKEGAAPLLQSRDPRLAGGEQAKKAWQNAGLCEEGFWEGQLAKRTRPQRLRLSFPTSSHHILHHPSSSLIPDHPTYESNTIYHIPTKVLTRTRCNSCASKSMLSMDKAPTLFYHPAQDASWHAHQSRWI